MEMEDHNLHHFQEQQQYGMAELRHLMNATRSPPFQALELGPAQPTPDLLSTHRNLSLNPTIHYHQHQQHLEMLMFGRQVADVMPLGPMVPTTATAAAAAAATNPSITEPVPITRTSASSPSFSGFEVDTISCLGGDAYSGRWPRQETLILLEIRSRLDPKFKEANQKGPLWDEVSRIMSEEHGYQRSGKKCREKFENLYKYYKKTKEGKVGRQDGKHYRFFRQLDAIYGGSSSITAPGPESNFIGSSFLLQGATSSVAPSQRNQDNFESTIKHSHSLSLTNTTDFDTSSSDMNELSNEALMEHDSLDKRRNLNSSRRGWQAKIRYFIDSQMKKLMERQEAWLERLVKTVEEKEIERISKEEEWRKQEAARLERAHKFQARERAWIKSRDAALVEALQKLSGQERNTLSPHVDSVAAEIQNQSENQNGDRSEVHNGNARYVAESWLESEVTRLMQLRYEMEYKFQQSGRSEDNDLWEEVAAKMACLGYEKKSALIYKEKWESIQMSTRNNKKWKENTNCCYFENIGQPFLYSQDSAYCEMNKGKEQETAQFCVNEGGLHSNSNAGNASSDSCYRLVIPDEGESIWKNHILKLNMLGNQNQ